MTSPVTIRASGGFLTITTPGATTTIVYQVTQAPGSEASTPLDKIRAALEDQLRLAVERAEEIAAAQYIAETADTLDLADGVVTDEQCDLLAVRVVSATADVAPISEGPTDRVPTQ